MRRPLPLPPSPGPPFVYEHNADRACSSVQPAAWHRVNFVAYAPAHRNAQAEVRDMTYPPIATSLVFLSVSLRKCSSSPTLAQILLINLSVMHDRHQ
jgi:hypothetical protein